MQNVIELVEYQSSQQQSYEPQTDVSTLVTWFEDAEEGSCDARKLAERDRDYYDGKQLTAEEISELRKRGQPDIVINRIKTKVNFLLGLESQSRTDPKAYPRNPQDEDAAEAATDALRFVEQKEQLDMLFSEVWREMLIEGFSGVEVLHRETKKGIEIDIKHWPYDRLFYDPHSRKHDFSDARYKGGVIWMDYDEAVSRWPDAKEILTTTMSNSRLNSYQDRPSWKTWASDDKRKRIRIVQMYYKESNAWHWCIFTEAGKLEGGKSPYLDDEGDNVCPLILQSAYIDRENNRYGEVRAMISPQDEINARRSALLHSVNVRQMITEEGAVEDIDEARQELAKRDGAIILQNPNARFEIRENTIQLQGHAQLLQEAKSEIDNMSANNALQGRTGSSSSGKAIIASQQGGLVEISPLTDRQANFKNNVYRAIWDRIRQFWDEERWIRVTDNDDNIKFVGLNRSMTVAEQIIEDAVKQGQSEEDAIRFVQMKAEGDPEVAQQLMQQVKVNVPADMDMDITIENAPDSINVQSEQFEMIANMAQAGVSFPPEVLIKASQLRNKRELIEALQPKQQQEDPMRQQVAQLQFASAEADLQAKHANIENTQAKTQETKTKAMKNLSDTENSDREQALKEQGIAAGTPISQFTAQGF